MRKRNYKNASAYGRRVRFLTEARNGAIIGLTFTVIYIALVVAMSGCGTPSGAAGTPDSASVVDVVGGSTDTSLPENDASNTDTVPVDNGSDATTDTADTTDSGSPDVGGDSSTDAGDTAINACPPADRPGDLVPVVVSGGELECVPDQNWKNYLDKVSGTDWYNNDTTVETCASATMELLPSTFQTTEQGWGEVGAKPAKYVGKPMLKLTCSGFGSPVYLGIESCTDKGCLATAPDWTTAGKRYKIWFSFENVKIRADFTKDALDMNPDDHIVRILYRKSE